MVRRLLVGYVVFVCLFLLLPLLVVLPTAFSTGALSSFPPEGFGLRWFSHLLGRPDWIAAFRVSAQVAVIAMAGALVVGVGAAIALERYTIRGRRVIEGVLTAPVMFPTIVIGIALLQWFIAIGIVRSLPTLAVAHVVITTPFVLRLAVARLRGSTMTRERAARSLGASPLRAYWHVTLPEMRAAIFGGAALSFIISMADVNVAIFLAPIRQRTLPVKLFAHIDQNSDPLGAAVAAFVIVLAVIVLLIVDRTVGLRQAFTSAGDPK